MHKEYAGVITRFLSDQERLMTSDEKEMPLVIEAKEARDPAFLQDFLNKYSKHIRDDVAHYGAILLRGFDISTEQDFEKTILSIQGLKGIGEAFMSEQGRIPVDNLKYVLHTNAVYKTGGTLYLGGFHSENYYSPDVPAYISFCCLKPSTQGGETGLVNMEKVYQDLNESIKQKLGSQSYFVAKWLLSEVANRYQISMDTIEKICTQFNLPIWGQGKDKFILMYKPSIFEHPETKKKSLQINLFELAQLNTEMRKCFMQDYQGKRWFWHRFVWKLPHWFFKSLESTYLALASFFYAPNIALQELGFKIKAYQVMHQKNLAAFNQTRVGSCFDNKASKDLAQLIRKYYSSCLWKKGDILIVDNRKVAHAGMPGAGPRLIRAMIANPLSMKYALSTSGYFDCRVRGTESIGFYMKNTEAYQSMQSDYQEI